MSSAALIVAAGRGSRMGTERPKQYLDLAGKPVLRHTVEAFLGSNIDTVQVIIHPSDLSLYDAAVTGLNDPRIRPPVSGGDTRAASVKAGLEALAPSAPERVLIHDAARPFCAPELIASVIRALNNAPGAFAALRVVDALWKATRDQAKHPVSREDMWRAQTPQGFHFEAILDAHRTLQTDAADDVAVAIEAGLEVRIVEGSEENFKITTPADLQRAERLIQSGS